jgi:hypothetical protein
MSQNVTGNQYRSPSQQSRLNAAQYRAIRKELLILRSEVERLELAEAGAELRQAVTRFRWLKVLVPGLSGSSLGKSAKNLNASLSNLVGQYPLLSSLASLVLAKPVRSLLRASAGPALKWGSLGFAAWEIYQFWKQSRKEREASPASDD